MFNTLLNLFKACFKRSKDETNPWLPISEHKRTHAVLGWFPDLGEVMYTYWHEPLETYMYRQYVEHIQPTHFMPLPDTRNLK